MTTDILGLPRPAGAGPDIGPHEYLPAPVIATPSPLPSGSLEVAYEQALTATDGTTPYTWSILFGSLPPGLSLSPDGVISGSPTEAMLASFTVQVTGSNGVWSTKGFSLAVLAPWPIITTTNPLPSGRVAVEYNQPLSAIGGTVPYAWSIFAGSLPTGLSLSSDGVISGTPSVTMTASFTVQVAGSDGQSSTRDFTLRVNGPPSNDMFANAIAITGNKGQIKGTNVEATKETGEPYHGMSTGGASVWYSWTAPTDGQAIFDTAGSSFDTLLGAYEGSSVDALTTLASNDDFGGLQSRVTFAAVSGTTYHIAVDGYKGSGDPATGSITLNWSLGPLITTASLPTGSVGVAYNHTLVAIGVRRRTRGRLRRAHCRRAWASAAAA